MVCDHVAILSRGRMIAQGPVAELLNRQGSVRLKTTDDARAGEILAALDCVSSVRSEGSYLLAESSPERASELTRALAEAQVWVTEMVPVRVSLERYFLDVTSESAPQAKGEAPQ